MGKSFKLAAKTVPILFFAILVATWLPASENRIGELTAKTEKESPEAIVLSLSLELAAEAKKLAKKARENAAEIEISNVIRRKTLPFPKMAAASPIKSRAPTEQTWLFVSSAMPDRILRRYARYIEAKNLPVKMIVRGLVGPNLKSTIDWIYRIRNIPCRTESSSCDFIRTEIGIDPVPFRWFGIERVPALARGNRVKMGAAERPRERGKAVFGDANLERLIEELESLH